MIFEDDFYSLGIDETTDILEVIDKLLDESVILPNKEIQSNIIKSYLLSPSNVLSKLAILLCYGKSGSGKSTLTKLACSVNGFSSNAIKLGVTTAAAIRNSIQNHKKEDFDDTEKHTILLWDDLTPDILISNQQLLSILKSGYDKKTATVDISSGTGKNMSFNCFCPKIISSIHPLWTYNELLELKRRTLVIKFEPYNELNDDDIESNKHPLDLLDLDSINFSGYYGFNFFWSKQDRVIELQKHFKKLNVFLKDSQLPLDFINTNKQVIAVNCLFLDISEVISMWELFYQYQLEILERKSALETFLTEIFLKQYEKVLIADSDFEIDSELLSKSISSANITDNVNNKHIKETMLKLGFIQKKSSYNNKLVWIKL